MRKHLVGIGLSILLAGAAKAQHNPCIASTTYFCSPPPSITLAPVNPNPIRMCICGTVSASTTIITNPGTLYATTIDEFCHSETGWAGPNYPTVVSNWTVVYWNGVSTTNLGLSTSFVPCSAGSGTITFYTRYTTPAPCMGTNTAQLTVNVIISGAPAITSAPTNRTVAVGDSTTFTVVACGDPTLTYQWSFNGNNIPGATTTSYTKNNVQFADAGSYRITVANGVGSVSSTAILTVTACDPYTNGLVSWWQGQNTVEDVMGLNPGAENYMTYDAGKVNQAFSINGTDVRVPLSPSTDVGQGGAFTIEGWVDPYGITPAQAIFTWRDGCSLWLSASSSGSLDATIKGIDPATGNSLIVQTVSTAAGVIAQNQFQHIALACGPLDGGGNLPVKMFVNGAPAVQTTVPNWQGVLATGEDLYLGTSVGAPWSSHFYGLMDEVALYNRALSAAEIQTLYRVAAHGKCPIAPGFLSNSVPAVRATAGNDVTLHIPVRGTSLTYQWYCDHLQGGGPQPVGGNQSTLFLGNVPLSAAGLYTLQVTSGDGLGTITSPPLALSVYPASCVSAAPSLVSWWEGENNAEDVLAVNPGILEGYAGFWTGKTGSGFSLSGQSFVLVPSSSSLNVANESISFTIEGWINPSDVTIPQPLFTWQDGVTVWLGLSNVGSLDANIRLPYMGGTIDNIISAPMAGIAPYRWTHVAVVFDLLTGSFKRLFVNGVKVQEAPPNAPGHGHYGGPPLTGGDLYFGYSPFGFSPGDSLAGTYFFGNMDEVAIYNRGLSETDIQSIYNAGNLGRCEIAPVFISQPVSQTVTAGNDASFQVRLKGTALSYQWLVNKGTGFFPTGDNQPKLYLPNVQAGDQGTYKVQVTTDQGTTVDSSAATLTVVEPAAVPAPVGVVGWWRGEGDEEDVLGFNPLSVDGNISFVAGKIGQAFDLSGYTDLKLPGPVNWNSTWNGFTIEAWIKPNLYPDPTEVWTPQPVIEQFDPMTGEKFSLALSMQGPGSVDVRYTDVAGGVWGLSPPAGVLRDGVFQHIAVTHPSDGTLNIYVNGRLVARLGFAVPIQIVLGATDLYFGFSPSGSFNQQHFSGKMDEITIYSHGLADSDIQAIYGAGKSGKIPPCKPAPADIVSWWQANGDARDVFNNNSGILAGGVTFGAGEKDQAFIFSGAASVRVPHSVSLNVGSGTGFTIEAWVNPASLSGPQPILEWNSGFLTGVAIWMSSSGNLYANLRDNQLDDALLSGAKLTSGTYQHVALTYDQQTASAHLYLNGVDVGQQTSLFPIPPLTTGDFYVGFSPADDEGPFDPQFSTGTQFQGQIDEVALYQRGLSAAEIRKLYSSAGGGKCGIAPVIVVQPVSQTANVGNNVALNVIATGTSLTYQWSVNHGAGVQPISGATSSTLTLPNVQLASAGSYYVQVANDVASVVSSPAVLTVNSVGNGTPPVIGTQPQSLAACEGESPLLTVSATGSGTLRYQWCRNTINVAGATSSSYVIVNVTTADSGTYTAVVYDSVGHVTSAGATVTVNTRPSASLLGDTTTPAGVAVPIIALLAGTPPWSLTWSDGTTENNVTTSPHAYWVTPDSTRNYKLLALSDAHCAAASGDLGGSVKITVQGASLEPPKRAIGQDLHGSYTDFSFGGDMWFNITGQVDLYGTTTIEGGTTILFADNPDAKIIIHDPNIVCDTGPYRTATFMVEDVLNYTYYFPDPSFPPPPGFYGQGLALAFDGNSAVTLKYLQFFNLASGVSFEGNGNYTCTLYDCQFIDCSNALVQVAHNANVNVFNALVSDATNVFRLDPSVTSPNVTVQHLTADHCQSFVSGTTAGTWNGKNSLFVNVHDQSTIPTSLRTSPTCRTLTGTSGIFQPGGDASHYLAGSAYRGQGTLSVDATLLAELTNKTTYPPMDLPLYFPTDGSITFAPQAKRYSTGSNPDLGYYYDALDYTVSDVVVLDGGNITLLPGTVIGLRYDWFAGFNLLWGSSFSSHGTPTRPNIFAPVSAVQEGPFPYLLFPTFIVSFIPWYWPEVVADPSMDPDFNPGGAPPPVLDFRFSNFYLTAGSLSHHFWGGMIMGPLDNPFFIPETSVSSVMSLTLQDCGFHSGWINLGEPDGGVIPPVAQPWWPPEWVPFGGPPIPGSVSIVNNLFDRVNTSLDPDTGFYWWGGPYGLPTIDMQIVATNNTFRGGWLYTEPVIASAGNWVFENNLFDKTVFAQDQYQPLDYDYNAYWPCESPELLPGQVSHLLQTTTGDGYGDGTYDGDHELKLTAPPPYVPGPLGNFYQTTESPLIDQGSKTADQVGLYHYTTQVNQNKEGNSPADVGLHYVAVDPVTGLPKDSDTPSPDGIPDYIEDYNGNGYLDGNETDWQLQKTDGLVADVENPVYDDLDLDGDGLNGAAERALGTNPLVSDNPLAIPNSPIPDTVSGKVSIPLPALAGADDALYVGFTVNGEPAAAIVHKVSGTWTLDWDTTVLANGLYYVGFELTPPGEQGAVVCPVKSVSVQNDISFLDALPIAGDTLFVNPQTIFTRGTWTMEIYDDQDNLFDSLQGQVDADGFFMDPVTSQPGISIDLNDGQGNDLPSDYYTVVVTEQAAQAQGPQPPGGSATGSKKYFRERPWSNYRPGKWVVVEQPLFRADSPGSEDQYAIVNSVVDFIYANTVYSTAYGGDAVINTPPRVEDNQVLKLKFPANWQLFMSELATTPARNLFYFGHCDSPNGGTLGYSDEPTLSLNTTQIRGLLHNSGDGVESLINGHPYRFVFICGCNSANTDLPLAFGIPKVKMSSAKFTKEYGLPSRAFLGFADDTGFTTKLDPTQISPNLKAWVTAFWIAWTTVDPKTGAPRTLQQAVDKANKAQTLNFGKLKIKAVIFGCDDLLFDK